MVTAVIKNHAQPSQQCQSDIMVRVSETEYREWIGGDRARWGWQHPRNFDIVLRPTPTTGNQSTRRSSVGSSQSSRPRGSAESATCCAYCVVQPWMCVVSDNSTEHCCMRLFVIMSGVHGRSFANTHERRLSAELNRRGVLRWRWWICGKGVSSD